MSKNVYIHKLGDIINGYNNTYHSIIKMKPIDVKSSTYIDFGKENNDKDPKFGCHVKNSNYKNISVKRVAPNWSEEGFVIKKIKDTVLWTYVIEDLNGEEIVGTFYEKEFRKTNQAGFILKKWYKERDKFYVKWKSIDNFFDSWIDKKDNVI